MPNLKKAGFFPLDEELALLPGQFTPRLQEHLAHLGSWMPFAKAAQMLARFTQVSVSESTAQRHTEAVGLAYQAVQLAESERIAQDWPEVAAGPERMLISVDGAFVPVCGGEWAEGKTLVLGEVTPPVEVDGQVVVSTHSLSYFSRLAQAETFQQLALGELYRRRVETATQVAAVSDGAEWIHGFVDYHCPEAVRILDYPHAAERLCQIGDVVLGQGSAGAKSWKHNYLDQLKHQGPAVVMPNLRGAVAEHISVPVVSENLAYLDKRIAQMEYPTFRTQGWPIGSGIVESANTLVVEARLKGSGMHWSRARVNPMVALRNAVCNDRWDEAWEQSSQHIRQVGLVRRVVTAKQAAAVQEVQVELVPPVGATVERAAEPTPARKPAGDHPWRRYRATQAQLN